MNYLLKQPSSSGLIESVLNGTKGTNEKCCYKNHFRLQTVCPNNVQFRSSTYISALKIQLEKKKMSKNEKVTRKTETGPKKLMEMLKVMPPKPSIKKILSIKKRASTCGMLGWNSKYIVDCIKSYDPNLLNYNLDLKELGQHYVKNKKTLGDGSNLNSFKSLPISTTIYKELGNLNCNPCSSILTKKPERLWEKRSNPEEKCMVSKEKHVKNSTITEPLRLPWQIEVGTNPMEPFENPQGKTVTQEQKLVDSKRIPRIDFSQDYVCAQTLHSSIDICITNNMVKEAYLLFQSYRQRPQWQKAIKNKSKIIQDVYNSVLYALSSKGYWCIMKMVLQCMERDKVKLNSASFAALLNCLVTIRKSSDYEFMVEEVSWVLNLVFLNNIPLNDVFCKTLLLNDSAEEILAIIREVIPSFEIESNVMELSSDCPLLKNLHKESSNLQPQLEGVGVDAMQRLVEEQLIMEKNFYIDVKAISRGQPGEAPYYSKKMVTNLKKEWRNALTEAVAKLLRNEEQHFLRTQSTFNLYIYLSSLPVEKHVDILMETTQNLVEFSGGFSPTTSQFRKMLGMKVFQAYHLRKKDLKGITDKVEQLFKKYVSWYCNPSGPAGNSRQKWQMVIQDFEKSNQLNVGIVHWPDEVLEKIGNSLLNIILKEIKFCVKTGIGNSTFPALYTILRCRENIYREEIKCHPTLAGLFESVGFDVINFPCEEVPMLCPPRPWTTPNDGGYLFLYTDFIRKKGGVQGKLLNLKDVPVQQLYATLDSLNSLQAVPWIINEDVLDVAMEVFKSGGSEKLAVPLFPVKPPPGEKWTDLNFEERRKRGLKRKELIKKLQNNYGLWCEALYRLSLANHYRKRVFWMPQNCDFRGRVYPVPPLVNHLGSDMFRSLLIFAKGKPLGPKGLDWLKIHLINLTGTHKKKSVEERLAYANEVLPEILDSAENPLTGGKWWMESDEPWQTLATCIEIKKALSVSDPETYLCGFPIHQDGSCNGLQHYAALGKDLIGAESVNLTSCDKPQDVYNVVAGLVEQERAMDALNGIKIAQILDGFIGRKVVKQTIMTTVYGVTVFGAKLQISKRLEEIPDFPEEHIQAAAAYLTNKIFLSLKKMFTSAKQIQDWFINCAGEICQRGEYVQWITPLGLPVLQSYAKYRLNANTNKRMLIPDSMKQKNAFPPNFVHSLDSCHMMLTSLYCEQAGLTFAAVHDCFWTHANTVDIMNRICREQFIALHSQAVLEELSQFFKKTYANAGMSDKAIKTFESVPEKGDFDIGEVLNSVYFFS